jgi:queuine tRNA-ribosyltransferase
MLLTWHNLTFYQDIMQGLRQAIESHAVAQFARTFLGTYTDGRD